MHDPPRQLCLTVDVHEIGDGQGALTSDHQIFLNATAGTIGDIQDRDDLLLVTDSQEVQAILGDLNYFILDPDQLLDFDGFFVAIQDGVYVEIYAFEGIVPYLYLDLWRLELQ